MPQAEPIYGQHKEAEAIIASLVDKYPERFGHVDASAIGCVEITGKDKPESQDWDAKISGIKAPLSTFASKVYVIEFFKKTWDDYAPQQRQFMLFRMLAQIPEKFDGGSAKIDLKDMRCLVKKFGVNYMERVDLPDLVKEKQDF